MVVLGCYSDWVASDRVAEWQSDENSGHGRCAGVHLRERLFTWMVDCWNLEPLAESQKQSIKEAPERGSTPGCQDVRTKKR